MGVGCATIVAEVPALQPRLNALRAKYARQIASQYAGGLGEFLDTNRAEWKDACRQLSPDGNEHAVPYLWDGFIRNMIATAAKDRLPWPLGAVVGGALGLVPIRWLPLPRPRKLQGAVAKL
jgi:hypothetical protein